MQDFLDLVAFREASLITRPNTPVHTFRRPDVQTNEFAIALIDGLNDFLARQQIRRRNYGDAADEWLPGRTPPELVKKHAAKLEELYNLMDAPSSPSECNEDDSSGVEFTLERRNKISQILHKHHLNYCPEQSLADSLPTPPSSNLEASRSGSDPISVSPDRKTPPSTPIHTTLKTTIARGKKRRRYDVAEGEEAMASQPCAKKNRTTAPAIPARRSARLRNARLQRDTG